MKQETTYKSFAELSPLIEALISSGSDVEITVTGNSMRPMLRHRRDRVVLTACNKFALKKGQLPLYKRQDGSYVLHRIVRVNEDSYDMCGDRQSEIERDVPKQSIIAVTKSFTRRERKISCDQKLYRVYVVLWQLLLPLRSRIFFWWSKIIKKKFVQGDKNA